MSVSRISARPCGSADRRRIVLLVTLTLTAGIVLVVRPELFSTALATCNPNPAFVNGTDITAGLESALICSASVALPAGTFYLDTQVHLHPGNVLVGAGMDQTVLKANADGGLGPAWPLWAANGDFAFPSQEMVGPGPERCPGRDSCRQISQLTLDGNWGRAVNVLGGEGTLINFVKVIGAACNGIVATGPGMNLWNSWVMWNGDMPGRSGHCVGAPNDQTGGPGIYMQPSDFTCGGWHDGWLAGCDEAPTNIAYDTIVFNGSFGLDTQGVSGNYDTGAYAEFHHNRVSNAAGGVSLFGSSRWHLHDNSIHGDWNPSIHTGHPTCNGSSRGSTHSAAINVCADDTRPCDANATPCPANRMGPAPWQSNGQWIENNSLSGWYGIALLGTSSNYPSGSLISGNSCMGSAVGVAESHPGANTRKGNAC